MKLAISTPLVSVVDTSEAVHVRAEDASGSFGVLQGHADFLTVLAICVLAWRDAHAREHYVAVRGGLFKVKNGDTVTVATPEAVPGEDLHQLESEVLVRFRRHVEEERAARADAQRLHMAAIRRIVQLLRPDSRSSAPGGPGLQSSSAPWEG
jgi:F-type H+-transporting ATPase subunit epsilon